eukprot:2614716-Prymnesium_polylepis.1
MRHAPCATPHAPRPMRHAPHPTPHARHASRAPAGRSCPSSARVGRRASVGTRSRRPRPAC